MKCLIRGVSLKETPEERVRQDLLKKMVFELAYPRGLISVEKKISFRRYDIVCFTKEMQALILIECKAEDFSKDAMDQVLGYNEKIEAPFICLAGKNQIFTYWHTKKGLNSVPFLPSFKDLYENSKRC